MLITVSLVTVHKYCVKSSEKGKDSVISPYFEVYPFLTPVLLIGL